MLVLSFAAIMHNQLHMREQSVAKQDCLCFVTTCTAGNKVSNTKVSLFKALKDAAIFKKWSKAILRQVKLLCNSLLHYVNSIHLQYQVPHFVYLWADLCTDVH